MQEACRSLWLLFTILSCSLSAGEAWAQTIIGHVNGITMPSHVTGSYVIGGWACEVGNSSPIQVQLYVGGPAGTGTSIGTYSANITSGSGLDANTLCNATGLSYGFSITLANSTLTSYGGRLIYVYGVSDDGSSSQLLSGSGALDVPSETIVGNISGVDASSDPYYQYYVEGWACVVSEPGPISVQLYIGGPPGKGTKVGATYLANMPSSGSAATQSCNTAGSTYGYMIPLANSTLRSYAGKPIYVVGLSADGPWSAVLGNSDTEKVPHLNSKTTQGVTVPKIWFSPLQDAVNSDGAGINYTTYDFPAMVASITPWQNAASYLSALGLDVVHIVEAYPNVQSVISMDNTNNFPVVGGGAMVFTNGSCTIPTTEGVSSDTGYEHETYLTLHQWKLDGGSIAYIGMDGPFNYGYYALQQYCNFTIEQVAQSAATTVNMILEDYPNAQIVDEEGPGALLPAAWLPQYAQFVSAFNAVSHVPIGYLAMDMHWVDTWDTGYDWVDASSQITQYAHGLGMKVGLFMDADDQYVESANGSVTTTTPMTDAHWMQQVEGHMQLANQDGMPLDFIYIASWMDYPLLNLPQTNSTAFTYLVDYAHQLWYK